MLSKRLLNLLLVPVFSGLVACGGGKGGTPVHIPADAPTTAPTAPVQDAADVVSVYSDTFTSISGVNTNPDWDQDTVTTEEVIAENNLLKLSGLNYQGIDFDGNRQNTSCLTNLHVDYWTGDATSFKIYAIGDLGEVAYDVALVNEEWQSLDIPLSTYDAAGLSQLRQFKFEGDGTVFLDNIYFYNSAGSGSDCMPPVADPTPTDAPTAPTADAANVDSIYSDTYTDVSLSAFPTGWSNAIIAEESIASNNVQKLTGGFIGIEPTTGIDGTNHTHMHIDVWAAEGEKVLIKVRDYGPNGVWDENGDDSEIVYEHTLTANSAWEGIDVPLTNATKASLSQVVVDAANAGSKIYFDNVYFYGSGAVTPPSSTVALPVNFEDASATYNFVDFDGGAVTVIDNPQTTDNTSSKVAQMVKDGGDPWGGSKLILDTPIDFTSGEAFTMNVWSSRSVPVLFKLEGADANTEVSAAHGGSGWESLTFDLAGNTAALGSTTDVVVIFDLGTVGDATTTPVDWTFYFDDIAQTTVVAPPSAGSQIDLPVTFDATDVDYAVTDFGGATSALVVDPADANNKVMSTVKAADAQTWAGTTIGLNNDAPTADQGFATVIPFTATATTMSVDVYSPAVGSIVRLKVEKASDNTVTAETETLTTKAGEWETLVFDLNNVAAGTAAFDSAAGYNKASIFFNFGTDGATAGEQTYHWDNVVFGGATPEPPAATVALPLDFELAAESYTVGTFGGAAFEVTSDPADAGNNALKMTRANGTDWWSGGTVTVDTPVDATSGTFSMDVYSTTALGYVELKFEQDGSNLVIMTTTHGGTGWETLSFDTASGTVTGAPSAASTVVFTPRVTSDGSHTQAADEVYYIDDIMAAEAGATTVALPLDFELAAESYTVGTFGGAAFEVTSDPADAGNNALKMTRANGTDWWSGGTVTVDTPVDATSGTFSMDVYSTTALGYVELKFEQDGSNLVIMTTTHGGTGWETLSFDTASGTVTGAPSAASTVVFTPRVTSDGSHTQAADEVYYIDGIMAAEAGATTVALPLDFELAAESYTVGTFGGAAFEVTSDPADAGNNALKMTRANGTDWWSGGTVTVDTPVDATSGTFSMDVYSTTALGYVELKFEQDGSNFVIMTTTHGGTGWETLSFDTASGTVTGAPSAASIVVFTPRVTSDGSHTQTADEVYYIDDIMSVDQT